MAREKIPANHNVLIYYDMVEADQSPYYVLPGCPFIEMPWRQAVEYAEKKISNKEWKKYLIPLLTSAKVIYLGDEDSEEEKVIIKCSCGNYEELDIDESHLNTHQFIFSSKKSDGSGESYYICLECQNEVESKTN